MSSCDCGPAEQLEGGSCPRSFSSCQPRATRLSGPGGSGKNHSGAAAQSRDASEPGREGGNAETGRESGEAQAQRESCGREGSEDRAQLTFMIRLSAAMVLSCESHTTDHTRSGGADAVIRSASSLRLFRLFRRLAIGSPPWSQSEQPGLTNAMPTARCSLERSCLCLLTKATAGERKIGPQPRPWPLNYLRSLY